MAEQKENEINLEIETLMKAGFTIEEATMAIRLSNNDAATSILQYQCFCGRYLMNIPLSEAYDGNGLYCDKCGNHIKDKNVSVWHCDKNDSHSHGYDICNDCIASYRSQNNKIQPDVSNSNDEHKRELSDYLADLLEIDDAKRNKAIKLLLKIIDKILTHPSDPKYRDLNCSKIKQKFVACQPCFDLLLYAGFQLSKNQQRLVWIKNDDNLRQLKSVYDIIQRNLMNNENDIKSTHDFTANMTEIKNNSHNSTYLMSSTNISSLNGTVYNCDLTKCLCIKEIGDILKLYHGAKTNTTQLMQSNNKAVITMVDVVNDFNHLLSHHAHQFEDIYNMLSSKVYGNNSCNLSKCFLMRRHQRDREKVTKNEFVLNLLFISYNEDVLQQQLLDRIHCYLFHTFDIGYKLTNKEKQDIMNAEIKLDNNMNDAIIIQTNEVIKSKQSNYRNNDEFNRLNNPNSKFKTEEKKDELQIYDYGCRFYYWQYSKNDHNTWRAEVRGSKTISPMTDKANWYIENKYRDLKEELTNNSICFIGALQFEHLVECACVHMRSHKVKQMFCAKQDSAKCYDMYFQQQMSINHVISMMVYCNFDTLQRKFSETFRKLDQNETDESLKKRHENFYFLARLLRESVECFGMNIKQTEYHQEIPVFHGVNQSFSLSSMDACIKGPFSTTTDYAVATNFCNNQGMVLEMFIPVQSWGISNLNTTSHIKRIQCMDMQWLSDFPNEQEIFCIGGLKRLYFASIIEPLRRTNLSIYIGGLRTIAFGMVAGKNNEDDFYEYFRPSLLNKQMAFRLLSHELYKYIPNHEYAHEFKSFPEDVENILHSHCTNVWKIQMKRNYDVMNYFFMDKKTEWIKLSLLTTVFPNVKCVVCNGFNMGKSDEWLTNSSIYETTLEFISKNDSLLDTVVISFNPGEVTNVMNCIQKYQKRFGEYSWTIDVDTEEYHEAGDFDSWARPGYNFGFMQNNQFLNPLKSAGFLVFSTSLRRLVIKKKK
eukprot:361434_1